MEYITISIHIPFKFLISPYFAEIKLLNTEILKQIKDKIFINKSDIFYYLIDYSIDYKNKKNKQFIQKIYREIMDLQNNDIKTICKFSDYKPINTTTLTDFETTKYNDLINKYKNEYKRVLDIKRLFIDQYIDATNLKPSHLTNQCCKRQFTTSKCFITEFILSISDYNKKQNFMIKHIKEEYNKILFFNNITNIKIQDGHVNCCFLITKIYKLFDDYLKVILYCLKVLETNQLTIREQNTFLFDIQTLNSYFYTINNEIYINI